MQMIQTCLFVSIFISHYSVISVMSDVANQQLNPVDSIGDLLCPVSKAISSNSRLNATYFSYPMDLFDIDQYQLIAETQSYLFDNCNSFEYNTETHITGLRRYCSTFTRCPLQPQNIIDAIQEVKDVYTPKHSLCQVYQNLINKDTDVATNIFVFGGSVTIAEWSGGCHRQFEQSSHLRCPWVEYIQEWLREYSNIHHSNINLFNMATGGFTLVQTKEYFHAKLKRFNITSFSSNDIIFIDHSVNDGYSLKMQNVKSQEISRALSVIIQQIYKMSKSTSWPSIILLEMYPIKNHDNIDRDYHIAYIRPAELFKIPIWSYRNILYSSDSNILKQMKPYLPMLMFQHQIDIHPPWQVHLYYADMIASLLSLEFHQQCESNIGNYQFINHTRDFEEMNLNNYKIEKSLAENNCDDNIEPLIYFNAYDYLTSSKLLLSKSLNFTRIPKNSWNYRIENKGKPGLVDEDELVGIYNPGNLCGQLVKLSKRFNSNKLVNRSETYTSILTFFLSDINLDATYSFNFNYLRTYNNSGVIDVFLCNQLLQSFDSYCEYPKLLFLYVNDIINTNILIYI